MMQEVLFRRFTLSVAGISISVDAGESGPDLYFSGDRKPVLSFLSENSRSDLAITVRRVSPENLPVFKIEKKLFSTEQTWSLYRLRDGGTLFIDAPSPEYGFDCAAIIDCDFKRGDIYMLNASPQKDAICDPLSYPLDQILMIHLLGMRRGALVHSCGAVFRGDGLLFIGTSGAGKTTTANLLGEDGEFMILNDDRIIIRDDSGKVLIHGTPWHGTGRLAKPGNAPLKSIFFLKHGNGNYMKPLSAPEALARLYVNIFSATWDRASVEYSLSLASRIAQNVRSYELSFLPDKNVVRLIKEMI